MNKPTRPSPPKDIIYLLGLLLVVIITSVIGIHSYSNGQEKIQKDKELQYQQHLDSIINKAIEDAWKEQEPKFDSLFKANGLKWDKVYNHVGNNKSN